MRLQLLKQTPGDQCMQHRLDEEERQAPSRTTRTRFIQRRTLDQWLRTTHTRRPMAEWLVGQPSQ